MKTNQPTCQRLANFELLRIIAMLMILIGHADYMVLGQRTDFSITLHAFTIVGVNVFVLISGWFGIKSSWRSLFNFIFQWGFYLIGIGAVGALLMPSDALMAYINDLVHLNTGLYWFCIAYFTMYFFAPMMNMWTERATKQQQLFALAGMFTASMISYMGLGGHYIGGYSTIFFLFLYLLGRYASRHLTQWTKFGFALYFVASLVTAYVRLHPIGVPFIDGGAFCYNNPMIILAALGLVMGFSRINIAPRRSITMLAGSSFAVYLFHASPAIWQKIYAPWVQHAFNRFDGLGAAIAVSTVLIGIYLLAVLIDQLRIRVWRILIKSNATLNLSKY